MKLISYLSIILLFVTFGTISVNAQMPTSIDGVNIEVGVDNPRPGQRVEVYVESFVFDLNAASIVWLVNGKTSESGIGLKKVTVVAPPIGATLTITAVVKTADGKEIKKSVSIKTGSVDIIWESDGYSPPFYEGKMPFIYENTIKLIALPHLSKDGKTELDPKTLVYTWKQGGKYIEGGQGYGIQSVTIPSDSLPRPVDVTVDISDRTQTVKTSGSISLAPGEPEISFYEDNSLYGILFNKALSERVPLKNKEMRIIAVPFGFNNINQNSYVWSINNVEQSDLIKNRSITIRTKEGVEGSSDINLSIRNQDNILQGALKQFSIYFSKTN